MRIRTFYTILLTVIFFCAAIFQLASANPAEQGKGKKILVVMSYHQDVVVEQQIKNAIDDLLPEATIRYFWLDTKNVPAAGPQKAQEAYALYQEFKPDAVIAANDSAQSLFVVPYLKDKTTTPVIFCGVNDEAGKYGYPAANVTGVLEKKHYRESISFSQIIDPAIRKIGVIYKDNLSNRSNLAQIERERSSYNAQLVDFIQVDTVPDITKAVANLSQDMDALLILDLAGILDEQGNHVEEKDIHTLVGRLADKVTIGTSEWEIEAGLLCGVIKRDREQGILAVEMLQQLWSGKTVAQLPLTENTNGRRLLNILTLKRLNRKLVPEAILGTKIVPSSVE